MANKKEAQRISNCLKYFGNVVTEPQVGIVIPIQKRKDVLYFELGQRAATWIDRF